MTLMEAQRAISARIKYIISIKGLYQSYVANRIGVTEQQFSDMLNGRKVIRAEHVPIIAEALDVEPNDLFVPTDKLT